jgi:hypothetical protein
MQQITQTLFARIRGGKVIREVRGRLAAKPTFNILSKPDQPSRKSVRHCNHHAECIFQGKSIASFLTSTAICAETAILWSRPLLRDPPCKPAKELAPGVVLGGVTR